MHNEIKNSQTHSMRPYKFYGRHNTAAVIRQPYNDACGGKANGRERERVNDGRTPP